MRESSDIKSFWIPAFAGMTFLEVALNEYGPKNKGSDEDRCPPRGDPVKTLGPEVDQRKRNSIEEEQGTVMPFLLGTQIPI